MWEQILKGSFLCLKSWVTQVALKGREQADKVWELRKTSPDWFKGMFRDLLRTPGKSWMSWGGWKIVPILWGLGSRKSSRVTSHTIETPTFLLLCKVQDPQLLPIRISKPSFRNISLHGPRGWLFKARSVAPCKEENTHPFTTWGPWSLPSFPSSPCYFFSESSAAPALSTGISWKVPLFLVFVSFQWISPNDIQIYKLPVLQKRAMDHAGHYGFCFLSIQSPFSPMTAWEVLHPHSWLLTCKVLWERPSLPCSGLA